MKRKRMLFIAALIILAAGSYTIVKSTAQKSSVDYQLGTISRGNLESTISATGTLTPLVKIDVGTQVSGTLDTVYVDFNDTVHAGQVLAVLDTTVLSSSVQEAEANVERCEAALVQADYNYRLNKTLYSKGMASESDSVPVSVNFKTQLSALKSAKISLDRAKRNMEYAVIKSPINGIVVTKNVESGQTVAASFSTPTLFVIAKDLSLMKILAEVDESDIGQIKEGQDVRFEAASYSDKQFTGIVTQIRLQPSTVSNVVTYTVVIEAKNDDGLLLPGMTATIDFITDKRTNVLTIPSKALKFQPSDTDMEAFFKRMGPNMGKPHQSANDTLMPPPPEITNQNNSSRPQNMALVWYLDSANQLSAAPVETGMTDGTNTEIVSPRTLSEGMKVITGTGDSSTVTKKTTSTFGPGGGGPGGPPPGL